MPDSARNDQGLAAMSARPVTHPVTQLARDILHYYAYESAIMSYVHDTPSPFESVNRAYFAINTMGYGGDRDQLRALNNELFIRMPRLVKLVRSLHLQSPPPKQLLYTTLRLSKSLLELQNSQAEERLLRNTDVRPSSDPTSLVRQSLHFTSVRTSKHLQGSDIMACLCSG